MVAALMFMGCGCSQARPSSPPEPTNPTPENPTPTAPTPAPITPTPQKHRTGGLDKAARDALKTEYHSLALKNDCSGALKKTDGTWRFIGETRTPEYSDVLTINGSKFTEVIGGKPDGKRVDARLAGEIRCLFKNRVLVQIDTVEPTGAFGNTAGDSYPCDMLGDMSGRGERMLMICYFDWDVRTAAGLEFEYERVKRE